MYYEELNLTEEAASLALLTVVALGLVTWSARLKRSWTSLPIKLAIIASPRLK